MSLTQTDFSTPGPTYQFVLVFNTGEASCTFTYPYSDRIDHIKKISLKEFVLTFDSGPGNTLPDTIQLSSTPSVFKRNAYYPTNVQSSNSDCIAISLVNGPFTTPDGHSRFSNSSSKGIVVAEVEKGSQRSLPNPITFHLSSSTFTPTVPVPPSPFYVSGGNLVPVAEQSTIILEIETYSHKLEDQRNPLYSMARPYYL